MYTKGKYNHCNTLLFVQFFNELLTSLATSKNNKRETPYRYDYQINIVIANKAYDKFDLAAFNIVLTLVFPVVDFYVVEPYGIGQFHFPPGA